MKKLLILTAVTILLAGAPGCNCFKGFCRGSAYPVGTSAAVCDPCAPCAPVAAPCDPCGGASAPMMPGPTTTYIPGPVN